MYARTYLLLHLLHLLARYPSQQQQGPSRPRLLYSCQVWGQKAKSYETVLKKRRNVLLGMNEKEMERGRTRKGRDFVMTMIKTKKTWGEAVRIQRSHFCGSFFVFIASSTISGPITRSLAVRAGPREKEERIFAC